MAEDRVKVTFWLTKEQKEKLDKYVELAIEESMTAFIISAIDFYGGYNLSNKSRYLPLAVASAMESAIKISEDRISRLLFKNTVELAIAMNVIAANYEIDSDTMKKLRKQCIAEVKGTIGKINFEDVYRYQKE